MGYWDKFDNKGIPFMDNRDKGDMHDILGEPVHIIDFGFIRKDDEEGDYGVIALKEHDDLFYFVNQVITDMLHEVENDGMKDDLAKQVIKFKIVESKKGREYFAFEFTEDNIPF